MNARNIDKLRTHAQHLAGNLRKEVVISSTKARHVAVLTTQHLRKQKPPLCYYFLRNVYHKYGLKHVILLLVLVFYAFIGATVFCLIEEPHDLEQKLVWQEELAGNRSRVVDSMVRALFNNSRFLVFVDERQTLGIVRHLDQQLQEYERMLGVKHSDQKIGWDFWNAMLYAAAVFTTIGYGHIYPSTNAGRLMTMIYALCGIPLVLTVLNDFGKLLTIGMKFPWFQVKRAFRRVLRLCTKRPMEEILAIEKEERDNLHVFDLPIPVAIGLVIGWIFLCSATFCIWEKRWDYFVAFYFFFISLSTIGLGDIVPDQPKYLLMMFGYIIVGLSLVSMCINLIQRKLEKTYQAGQDKSENASTTSGRLGIVEDEVPLRTCLGIMGCNPISESMHSIAGDDRWRCAAARTSRQVQTNISLPIRLLALHQSPETGHKSEETSFSLSNFHVADDEDENQCCNLSSLVLERDSQSTMSDIEEFSNTKQRTKSGSSSPPDEPTQSPRSKDQSQSPLTIVRSLNNCPIMTSGSLLPSDECCTTTRKLPSIKTRWLKADVHSSHGNLAGEPPETMPLL